MTTPLPEGVTAADITATYKPSAKPDRLPSSNEQPQRAGDTTRGGSTAAATDWAAAGRGPL